MSARYLGGVIAQTQLPLNPAAGNAANGVFTMSQYMQAVKNATWPGFDPYFNETVLLLHGNGTNGAQNNTFLDSSSNNFTITRNGNTTQGTFSPFSLAAGEWSNYFDGVGDYLFTPKQSSLVPAGDFTIEVWVYPTTGFTGQVAGLHEAGTSADWILGMDANGRVSMYIPTSDIFNGYLSAASAKLNQWNHIVASRTGSTLYVGVNGTLTSHSGVSGSLNYGSSNRFSIGADQNGDESNFTGYISNFRMVSGTGLYTGSTYSIPTTPLTAITNTSLLTCQSNRFVDNSTNAFAITANGDVRVTPFSPFAPTAAYSAGTNGGSGYFDGNTDWLTAGAASDWTFLHNGSDWTCEFWVYHSGTAVYTIVSTTAFSAQIGMSILVNNTYAGGVVNGVQVYIVDGGGTVADEAVFNSTGLLSINQWNYVAITFTSSTKTCAFTINGASAGSTSNAGFTYSASNPTNTLAIGRYQGSTPAGYLTGYLGSLRISTNVRTGLTSVPTAPYTSDANTKLLLNFTNAGIIDNTGKNNLETVGNAQIDTTIKRFGDGSLEFDGTGDRLLIPSSADLDLSVGDFTIECWVYTNTIAAGGGNIAYRGVAGNISLATEIQWSIYRSGSSLIVRPYASTTNYTITIGTIAVNTWYHVAFTRSGSTFRGFLNGISSSTTQTIAGALNNSTAWPGAVIGLATIGGADEAFNGYVDDLRITKGVARYTSNFAVPYLPQGPLPLVGGPYIPNTVLMLPGTGTNGAQNNTFLDSSTNNFTITRNGNTTQGTFTPFSRANGYWGNYFDGSGDFLDVPDNAALEIGANSFCIEAWINPNALPTTGGERYIVAKWISASRSFAFGYVNASGTIQLRLVYSTTGSTSLNISQNAPIVANAWQHIAVTRDGTTARFFLNGVQQGSTQTLNATFWDSTEVLTIGRFGTGGGSQFDGYLSNLRLVIGSAVYTSNFTPTGPLTAIANTQLLTCQSNRFADNSTNNFSVTPSGNAKVTTFSPFEYLTAYSPATNGGSGYFDGTGDYLSVANDNVFDTNSTFTLECFIYLNSTANQQFFTRGGGVGSWSTSNGHQFLLFQESGTLYWMWNNAGNPVWISTTVPAISQWVHLAVGYNGTTTRFWVNGSSVGSSATGYTLPTTRNIIRIGESPAAGAPTNGFISSLRFVKGSDVYGVSNTSITVPTAPLTNITNTALLTNFTNAAIYDASMSNDLETVGNAQVSTTQSKWGGGSMYFDGTDDKLTARTSSELAFGTGDFTIEFWLRVNTLRTTYVYDGAGDGGVSARPLIYFISNGTLYYSTNNGGIQIATSSGALQTNTWYHILVSRSGTSTRMFINGTQVGSTATDSTNYLAPITLLGIGGDAALNSNLLDGYISDLRVLKGVAILPTPLQTSQWQDQ